MFEKEYLRSAEDILKKRFEQKKSIELSAAQAAIEFAISFPVSLGLYQLYYLLVCLFVCADDIKINEKGSFVYFLLACLLRLSGAIRTTVVPENRSSVQLSRCLYILLQYKH